MIRTILTGLFTVALFTGTAAHAAHGGRAARQSILILPSQYFTADASSATNVSTGLAKQFRDRGYRVESPQHVRGYAARQNYSDPAIRRLAKSSHADFVAYPRLLAVGVPAARVRAKNLPIAPSAVVLLRVINLHNGKAIYVRQVGHDFDGHPDRSGRYHLTAQDGAATAQHVMKDFSHQARHK